MSRDAVRLAEGGGAIDRDRPLAFTFQDRRYQGFHGDTLASALLANGVAVLGRSFKYHRPRGLWGIGAEEPNAILDVRLPDGRHLPNARATLIPLEDGLVARPVHGFPSAGFDLHAVLDRLHPLIPAGFYYKTFMRPDWHLFEPRIRAMVGLGTMPETPESLGRAQRHHHCEVLVVGAGPAGLAAAEAAAATGQRVTLVDDQAQPGGALLVDPVAIDGEPGGDWAEGVARRLADLPNVTILPGTTAMAIFDHGSVTLAQRRPMPEGFAPELLWKVRAGRIILATGAIERPMLFPDNDRPGVMSAYAVRAYLARHGIRAGSRVVVLTNNAGGVRTADALLAAGAEVVLVDVRPDAPSARCRTMAGCVITACHGAKGIRAVTVEPVGGGAASPIEVDLVAVAGGWTPSVQLHMQGRGTLRFDDALDGFVPASHGPGILTIGSAAGALDTATCLAHGHLAGGGQAAAPRAEPEPPYAQSPWRRLDRPKARQWIDLQHDVTAGDVDLAVRENYVSVEHLKRYTTLGMANDQGKTSNLNGLALLAQATGRPLPEVGTTTFRPPFTPLSLATIAGPRRDELLTPLRYLPAHAEHERAGALFDEYGGWWRPACYPLAEESKAQAIRREVLHVRERVGLFDGSPLGKIEVTGKDAGTFLDRLFYHRISDLKPGRVRYVFMLTEHGKLYDDGVVARLDEHRFLLSPSSSHAAGVHAIAEEWRQTGWPELEVVIGNVTTAWATLAVTGPLARPVIDRLDIGVDLAAVAFPHMGIAEGRIGEVPVRIARVSFTGELSFEISVPAAYGPALFRRLEELGRPHGMRPYGSEALLVLRAEKGYLLVGRDSDGNSEPQDFGITAPLRSKNGDFVGRRSLQRPASADAGRLEFVGLMNVVADELLPTGAHVIERDVHGVRHSRGYVTSSYDSPTLGHGIALAIVADGRARQAAGAEVNLFHLGRSYRARVVGPVFYDPGGERLRG